MKLLSTVPAIAGFALIANSAMGGFYLEGSALFADVGTLKGTSSFDAAIDSSTGFTLGVGYKFSILAVEVEGLMLNSDIDGAEGTGVDELEGSFDQTNLFANVVVDIPGIPIVTPYIGGGVGFGTMDMDGNIQLAYAGGGTGVGNAPATPPPAPAAATVGEDFSGSDTIFGYQVFAGIRVGIPVTGLSAFAQYRYFELSGDVMSFKDAAQSALRSVTLESGGTSSIEVGVRYEF